MGSLFLIFILVFIILPILKLGWRIFRLQSQARSMYNQMNGARQSAGYQEPHQRKAGWSSPATKPKKIGKDVGEYVAYENITVTETTTSTTTDADGNTTVYSESRITDVEWEDVK